MKKILSKIDWWVCASVVSLVIISLSAMSSFGLDGGKDFFTRQLVWVIFSFIVFLVVVIFDIRSFNSSKNILFLYLGGIAVLISLFFFGVKINGARSWISFAGFSFQPADFMKLIFILIMAKYLARRHIEIKAVKHILITGFYFILPFFLIFLQPDFGSAIIFFGIWFGLVMVSGLSKKHLLILALMGGLIVSLMWFFVLHDYQKKRIMNFIHPLSDIRGTGYNAYQSTIAVGSGKLLGKGVGHGTQSRLAFLPEYQTDFIFAAISEEWGFVGSLIVVFLLFFIVARILSYAYSMNSNFERLFALGVAFYFMTHIIINIGMNIGIMPVTGVTLPFVSYGGSHLLVEFLALGMLMGMRGGGRIVYKDQQADAFLQ